MASEKRLIDANDALERLKKAEKEMMVVTMMGCKAVPMDGVIDFVASRPTVDAVEVVHGEWEDEYGGKYANPRYRCSVCKGKALYKMEQDELLSWHEVQALTDYCPNCGAKMDGERKDNERKAD